MSSPPPGLNIPWDSFVTEVRRVADGLIRVEAKLDSLASNDQAANERHADHEKRLRALEAARWPLPTLGALIGVAGVVLGLMHH